MRSFSINFTKNALNFTKNSFICTKNDQNIHILYIQNIHILYIQNIHILSIHNIQIVYIQNIHILYIKNIHILYDFHLFLVKIHGHRGPMGPCALGPKRSKGSGPALGPPVAMYFHKKGMEITYKKKIYIYIYIIQEAYVSSQQTFFRNRTQENRRYYVFVVVIL